MNLTKHKKIMMMHQRLKHNSFIKRESFNCFKNLKMDVYRFSMKKLNELYGFEFRKDSIDSMDKIK